LKLDVRYLQKAGMRRQQSSEMPALMYDLADRISDVFTEQFGEAGYDSKVVAYSR
jgi:hypothetical protein